MKKALSLVLICGIHISLFASGGICTKCEKIREYNRTHPSKHTYYEDYLEDNEDSDESDFTLPDDSQENPQNLNYQHKNYKFES
jgi:hypothetical protein